MNSTAGYSYEHNGSSSGQQTTSSEGDNTRPSDAAQPVQSTRPGTPEPADSMLNTSNDSNDDDAHTDAQLLSASILATIQSTPRHHATPPSRNTPNSTNKSSTPYLNGRHTNDSYDMDIDHKDNKRNGKTNNNMYPPSPTANITPRRRSTRVVKSAKPFPTQDNGREKNKEKEKDKEKKTDTPSTKRDSKSVSGSASKRARKRLAAANEADVPQPVPVLGRNLDLTTLKTGENSEGVENDVFADPNWAESISLYSLARSWMCSGVDLDPFHILRHDTAESVLVDMHDYIPPPALPPPSTTAPPALPERPRYPSSNEEAFEAALKKESENTPKVLLKNYVSNCKTFRTWWKANYTQRLSKYKGRLAVLFPSGEQSQQGSKHSQSSQSQASQSSQSSQSSQTSSQPSQNHPRTPSPPPRSANQHQPHRTPSPPPRTQIQRLNPPQSSSHSNSHTSHISQDQSLMPPPQPPHQIHPPAQNPDQPRPLSPVPRSQSPIPRSQSPVPATST